MSDKPKDKPAADYPDGAFGAFSETEFVGFDPKVLDAVYIDGVGYIRNGILLWPCQQTQQPTEPAQPTKFIEGSIDVEPSPAWIGTERPSNEARAAARRLQRELADGAMLSLLFGTALVDSWWTLKDGLARIGPIELAEEERPVAVPDPHWLAACAMVAAIIVGRHPPDWLVAGLRKVMAPARHDRPQPAELRRRLTKAVGDAQLLLAESISAEVHAALSDLIARAEQALQAPAVKVGARGVRIHDREYAALVVMVAWKLFHGEQATERNTVFWRAVHAYLEAAGGKPENRSRGPKQEDEDELDEFIADAKLLPDGRSIPFVVTSPKGRMWDFPAVATRSEAMRVAKAEAKRLANREREHVLQERLAEPARWVREYVPLAQRRALGPEGAVIRQSFLAAGAPAER